MTSPADPNYQLQLLLSEMQQLREQVDVLKRLAGLNGQRAKVTAFISGSAMCTVQFLATSNTASVPYLWGYTPVVNNGGVVVDTGGSTLFIPVSAYL